MRGLLVASTRTCSRLMVGWSETAIARRRFCSKLALVVCSCRREPNSRSKSTATLNISPGERGGGGVEGGGGEGGDGGGGEGGGGVGGGGVGGGGVGGGGGGGVGGVAGAAA